MRIAFFTQWWPPEPANIVASLGAELANRGHVLEVVTGFPNYPSGRVYPGYRTSIRQVERAGTLTTIRVPLFPSHDRSAVRRVASYVSFAATASTIGLASTRRPNVAYVYHPPITSAWPARLQRLLQRIPFVLHVQDLWPESVVHSGMTGSPKATALLERALDHACGSTYRSAARIVVISEGLKRILVDRGVAANKISVVLNWADESVFGVTIADPSARAELGPSGSRIVLYAGNLGDYQSLDAAVVAAAHYEHRLHLSLVGDGIARRRLEQLVNAKRITNVTILPRRAPEEIPRLLAAADAHLVSLADLPFLSATIPGKTQVGLASGKYTIMAVSGDAADLVSRARAGYCCAPTVEGFCGAFHAVLDLSAQELADGGRSARGYYLEHLSLTRATDVFERILLEVSN